MEVLPVGASDVWERETGLSSSTSAPRTSPLTYRGALLRARCQNGSRNKINITTEKLPEYVSVSIFGEVILFQKIILKNSSMDCCRHCVKHFICILNPNNSSSLMPMTQTREQV